MNIAFAGTHGTGKTTLLESVFHSYSNGYKLFAATEVARDIIERGFPLNQEANIYSYINYVNDQLAEEENMHSHDIFISDRTILDPLAYALVNRSLPRPYIPDYLIEMMRRVWLLEKEKYNLYVYFPIEFPMVTDGVRPEDEKYREDVDKMVLSILEESNIAFLTIRGSVQRRTLRLTEEIDKYFQENEIKA